MTFRRFQIAFGAGVALLQLLAAIPSHAFSNQQERELGQQFDMAARQQLPLFDDPEIVGYVDTIGQRIAGRLKDSVFTYQFSVVQEGSINAFAVPGGYIYVHSGLLTRAVNDDEVAAVLGHEVAHVHAHHLARQQEATKLMNYASLLGVLLSVVNPAIGALAQAGSATATLQYRREFEQEADYLGARYLEGTGYDPHAMLDFFQKLGADSRSLPQAPPYLLSHPLTDERLNHLEAVFRTQQWAARKRPPQSFALHRVQVLIRARSQPPQEVLESYRRLVDASPDDPLPRYLFGVVCLETGQLESAKSALTDAHEAGIEAADRELGRVALRQRQPERARDLLRASLAREPNDAAALVELAQALEALGDTNGAKETYGEALKLAPSFGPAHRGYALLAGRAGNQAEGFYHLATESRLRGEYTQALSQYARAQPLLPAGDARSVEVQDWIKLLAEVTRSQVPTPGGGK
jgi:predicted Zn-dependent protease